MSRKTMASGASSKSFSKCGLLFSQLLFAKDVVHGEGDVIGDQGEVADIFLGIAIGLLETETETAKPAMRGGEGKDAGRLHAVLPKDLHHEGKARLFVSRRNDNRLLMFQDPPRDGLFRREVFRDGEARAVHGFENGIADFVRSLVVQEDGDKIEADYGSELARQNPE